MARKCFISFKTEDYWYKSAVLNRGNMDIIDKSLDEPIESHDEDIHSLEVPWCSLATLTRWATMI
jgi:hypothetical protein